MVSPIAGTALITGGSSGIGLAFARELASRGLDLVLVARNSERLEAVASELRTTGISVECLSADLGTEEGIEKVKVRLLDQASPISVFVNSAGHGLYAPLVTTDVEEHRKALMVMQWAMLVLGGAAAVAMKERGRGHIINTASVSGLVPMGGYSAIKSWTKTYSESLYLQLRNHGVHVTTFMPGWVRTEFHARTGVRTSNIPDALWLEPDFAVRECLKDAGAGKVISTPSWKFKTISYLVQAGPKSVVRNVVAKINKSRHA